MQGLGIHATAYTPRIETGEKLRKPKSPTNNGALDLNTDSSHLHCDMNDY